MFASWFTAHTKGKENSKKKRRVRGTKQEGGQKDGYGTEAASVSTKFTAAEFTTTTYCNIMLQII